MDNAVYMHAKEFAQLLNTSKATLRHYRDIGLFEPARVTQSGYSLYGAHQASDYVLISSLKGAGCSLAQIKDYLTLASASELHDIFAEKVVDIERQQKILESRKQIIQASIKRADALSVWEDELTKVGPVWHMRECEQEYFIKTVIPFAGDDESKFFAGVEDHVKYCLAHGGGESFQAAHSIDAGRFAKGEYIEGFAVLTRLAEPIECDRLHVKPAGSYFCWLKRTPAGDYEEGPDANPLYSEYDAVRKFLQEKNLKPTGDVYESELSLYSGSKQEPRYSEIALKVASVEG